MFSKNLYFFLNGDFVENIFWIKVDFFFAILTFLMAALDAHTKFYADEISFFSFYLFLIKSYSFFVKKLPKLNILSVIAID